MTAPTAAQMAELREEAVLMNDHMAVSLIDQITTERTRAEGLERQLAETLAEFRRHLDIDTSESHERACRFLAQPATGTDPSKCQHDVSCATCGTRWPPRGAAAATAAALPEPPPLPPPSDDLLATATAAHAAYMIHTDQAAAAIRAAGAAEQAGVDPTAEESETEARERAEADLRLAQLAEISGEDVQA